MPSIVAILLGASAISIVGLYLRHEIEVFQRNREIKRNGIDH